MAAVDVGLPRFGIERADIADTFHAVMVLQPCADLRRAFASARHAQLQRLKAPEQHPGGMRVGDRADGVPHRADGRKHRPAAQHAAGDKIAVARSEEHTSELQSLMRISYAVFCLKKKNTRSMTPSRPYD